MTMPLTDAKARLSEVVDRAEAGETIEITRRGKVVAKVAPPDLPPAEAAAQRRRAVEAMRAFRATLPQGNRTPEEIKALCRDGLLGE